MTKNCNAWIQFALICHPGVAAGVQGFRSDQLRLVLREELAAMSALRPKADIPDHNRHVRFAQKGDYGSEASTQICNWQNEFKRRAAVCTV
jgi:hypothetical protein